MKHTTILCSISTLAFTLTACGGGSDRGFQSAGLEEGGSGGTTAAAGTAGDETTESGGQGGFGGADDPGSAGSAGSSTADGGKGGATAGGEGGSGASAASGGAGNAGEGGGGTSADGGADPVDEGESSPDAGAAPTCEEGYDGPDCQDCAFGYVESEGACVAACSVTDCGLEGTCELDESGGAMCVCNKGFAGDACDECAAGYRYVPVLIGDPIQCELDTPPTQDMTLWLDANDYDSFTLDGSTVVNWDSRVAGGYFSTADSSTRPTRVISFKNEPAVVRFDGVDDRLHRVTSFGNTYSVFVVGSSSPEKSLNQTFLHGLGESNIDRNFRLMAQDGGADLLLRHGMPGGYDQVVAAQDTTELSLIEAHRAFAGLFTALMVYDGTEYQSTAVTQEVFDQDLVLYLGRRGDSSLGALGGDVGEVLVFSPALDAEGRQDVRDYLTAKWGL